MMQTDEISGLMQELNHCCSKPDFGLTLSSAISPVLIYFKTVQKLSTPLASDICHIFGNNRYENARGYHGFQVGLGIPLYWGDHRSKVKASRIATNANELLLQNNLTLLEIKYRNLQNELQKFRETIDFYHNTGKRLSSEITRTATRVMNGEMIFTNLSRMETYETDTDYYEAVSSIIEWR